ncbi:MAG: hypothetical protein AAGF94_18090 [Pseudomonadota bacterium]
MSASECDVEMREVRDGLGGNVRRDKRAEHDAQGYCRGSDAGAKLPTGFRANVTAPGAMRPCCV